MCVNKIKAVKNFIYLKTKVYFFFHIKENRGSIMTPNFMFH